MNKQKYQQKIKNMKRPKFFNAITLDEAYEAGFEEAKNNALFESCFLDGPEKPVLTEEEAEWIDKLTDVYDVPDALYYITRCGYGYDFIFEICGKTYELPLEDGITYGELYNLKERLVNAVFYGYEIKKEKLYRARHKLTGEYLSQNYAKTGYYHGLDHFHILKLSKKDWEELGVLDDKVYEIEEVEE